ncbi:hypothetical protein MTY_0281 [Moorella thermoacetica Y72]|uniref:Uncharacterized protein n=1 Tax=Moorella thermoacetica Y72 TaxID=1325331 RepID=A0A0S6UBT0_NEOTH|nr:hypothetical protein MTY_0281 [Moorella thermoacetica Y72]
MNGRGIITGRNLGGLSPIDLQRVILLAPQAEGPKTTRIGGHRGQV